MMFPLWFWTMARAMASPSPKPVPVRLLYTIDEGLQVSGDRDALERLTGILLDNAVKYAPQGTDIRLTLTRQDRTACLAVENGGDPIPPEPSHPLVTHRPFRSPHHTASPVSLSGGGTVPRPGEISLAHNGILFLDELPEFDKAALETLRQPLEDGVVTITRASGSLTLPSRFMLVCAMNPCRCGWFGHPSGRCTCTDSQVQSYLRRISGPLLDRIDMHVEVPSVEYEAMRRKEQPETSQQVRSRVNAARQVQQRRYEGTGVTCNAYMTPAMIGQYCRLDAAGEKLMQGAFDRLGLTGRSHDRILRMARTIADLDGAERIEPPHLAEAIQYRSSAMLK